VRARPVNEPDRPEERAPGGGARRTPYELVFQPEEFEASLFPRIRDEAAARGVNALRADQFGFLSEVGDTLRALVPPDAPPEALEQYRALLFQAFNFWRFGKRVYVLEPSLARYLVEAAPGLRGWEVELPHPTVYVQLPANLFWSSIATDIPPEPVDGFFVTASEGVDGLERPFRRLDVLAVLGIRRNRAGFSIIHFDTAVGRGIATVWAETPGRDEGEDFDSVLPGGEMARLYSVLTTGEILKLVARALWYVDTTPEGVRRERVADAADRQASPPPPRLPFFRVSLDTGAEGEP
jgi:hypothetical protein